MELVATTATATAAAAWTKKNENDAFPRAASCCRRHSQKRANFLFFRWFTEICFLITAYSESRLTGSDEIRFKTNQN